MEKKQMAEDQLFYHYTDGAGLIGLLGANTGAPRLWMTQLEYMNDRAEYRHAYEVARQLIVERSDQWPNLRVAAGGLWGISGDANERSLLELQLSQQSQVFSFSLSEVPDLLSQWRGYVLAGGYCIGYAKSDLTRNGFLKGLKFNKVLYGDSDGPSALVDELLRIEQAYWGPSAPSRTSGLPPEIERNLQAQRHLHDFVVKLAPLFKPSGFSEEREWRLYCGGGEPHGQKRYRARGGAIIPYLDFSLSEMEHNSYRAIYPKRIIVSPELDFDNAHAVIVDMLGERRASVVISRSRSTLRR